MKKLKRLKSGGIWGEVASMAIKREKSKAVSSFGDDCVTGLTYGRLIRDAVSLAETICDTQPSAVLLHGGGAAEVALAILSASLAELPLILCGKDSPGAAIDRTLAACGSVFAISDTLSNRSMDRSEMRAAIEGREGRADGLLSQFRGNGFFISFLDRDRLDSYGEEAFLHSAGQYAVMSALTDKDVCLSDLPPSSPSGLICALLAPLISGGEAAFMSECEELESAARQIRPTQLLCREKTAIGALGIIKRNERGAIAKPVLFSPKRRSFSELIGEESAFARKRRLYAGRLMRLGGSLRRITVTDRLAPIAEDMLSEVGIVTGRLLSADGCPFVGLRTSLSGGHGWCLPKGLFADMCAVEGGGVGLLTLSGVGICIPSDKPIRRGCVPGEFRLDGWEGLSLVTDLRGYVLPNGQICLKNN